MSTSRAHRSGRHRSDDPAPLRCPDQAIDVIVTATSLDRPATVCLMVDDARWPLGCLVVDQSGPSAPVDAVEMGERLAEIIGASPEVAAAVLASIRPEQGCEPADAERLLELTMAFDAVGIELLEWFVVHPLGVVQLRAATGEPSRW